MLRLIIVCWQDVGLFVMIFLLQTLWGSVLSQAYLCFKALNYIRPNRDHFIHGCYNCLNAISQALPTAKEQKRHPEFNFHNGQIRHSNTFVTYLCGVWGVFYFLEQIISSSTKM